MILSLNNRFLLLLMVVCLSITPAYAKTAPIFDSEVVIVFSAERKGNFLTEPGNVPIEFLRRIGREINKNWAIDKPKLNAASLFSLSRISEKDFLQPVPLNELPTLKKKDAQALLDRYASEAETLLETIEPEEKCCYLRIVAETKSLSKALNLLVESDTNAGRLSPDQIDKIRSQLLPFLRASDYIIGAIVLSDKGLEARLRLCSIKKQLANPKMNHSLSIAGYINPSSLMVFAQTHPIENPGELMKEINKIPQTATVVSIVASAGLDFEKDILANSARESILYLNLEPDNETGIPDIRFVAPVPDMKKLEANLEKFKVLCMQTGIFINFPKGENRSVKLSHFMFPKYGVFASLFDRFLLLATSQTFLDKEIEFLKQVKSGNADQEAIQDGLQRYWRISFDDFNLQLQKLLQSPLLADKGVPPIPNLSLLSDLEDLVIFTSLHPDRIDISVVLPIKEMKEK